MQFTLLTTLANQHPPIIVGNRNKPLYCKVPDSLSESLARARLDYCMDFVWWLIEIVAAAISTAYLFMSAGGKSCGSIRWKLAAIDKMKWSYDVTLTTVTLQQNMLGKQMFPDHFP